MARRGVRYYRAIPPPREEWRADYPAMAASGLDLVVVPAPWSWCHVDEEAFDFAPIVEQLGLAKSVGLELVVAADLTTAPPWLTARYPEYLHEDASGTKALPRSTRAVACGGWPGLCFDNGTVRSHAGAFLRALAAAVVGQPALAAYDLSAHWALEGLVEQDRSPLYCQCAGSRARFIAWLRRTYAESLDALGEAWGRRCRRWAEAAPPAAGGPFPDVLDWARFQRETLAAHLRWCVEAVREADQAHPIVASGAPLGSEALADGGLMAREVAAWGCRLGDRLPHEGADRARGAARGKGLWLVGGDWPPVAARMPPRAFGEAARREPPAAREPHSMRQAAWSLVAAGADAVVYEGWRPEACAGGEASPTLARPDGSRSARVREARWLADLVAKHPDLADARPTPAEVAIVVAPESLAYWSAQDGGRALYLGGLDGAYRALSARGACVAFELADHLEGYQLAYAPLAAALSAATAGALRRYVESGGTLVAEAAVGRLDERGRSSRTSPGNGLDVVFGARAVDVPEPVAEGVKVSFKGPKGSYPCWVQREPLAATTGKVKASFSDGTAAIVDNTFGAGATRLIGTHPSFGCSRAADKGCASVIFDSLAFARVKPRVSVSSPGICVRLLEGRGALFLCAFSLSGKTEEATVTISEGLGRFPRAVDLSTGKGRRLRDNARRLKLRPAEGVLLRLETTAPGRRWRPRRRAKASDR